MRVRLLAILLLRVIANGQAWKLQITNSKASFRGLQALRGELVWASGSGGTWLRTLDGGLNWQTGTVHGAEDLDFRGLYAFSANRAVLMSAGPGQKSRVYRTLDGGASWTLSHTNTLTSGFYDGISFWDQTNGIIIGDPVDGRWTVMLSNDGGQTWRSTPGPLARPGEGAFAASNSCLQVSGKAEVWFASGGPGGARLFHSKDRGEHWTVVQTPIRHDVAGAGIFSFVWNGKAGVAVGGFYPEPASRAENWAFTVDRGKTWRTGELQGPYGYRSAVVFSRKHKVWISTGTTGSDLSRNSLQSWKNFDTEAFHALSSSPSGEVWASGPGGRIAKLRFKSP